VITAVSLIVVQLVLLLVSSFAARNHHVSENDEDIFRYPPVIRRSLFVGGLFVVGAGGLVYSTVPPTGAAAAPFVIGGLFGGMALADLYLYLYFSKYALRVAEEGLTVSGLWSSAHMQFSEIRELVVVVGGRLNDRLTVRSANNGTLRLGGGIQNFADLVWLIKSKSPHGTKIRECDEFGKWREFVT
jgi:hypothetical protein